MYFVMNFEMLFSVIPINRMICSDDNVNNTHKIEFGAASSLTNFGKFTDRKGKVAESPS